MGQILTGDGNGKVAANIHWCSPLWVTEGMKKVFMAREGVQGIDLDPCANPGSVPRIGAKVNLTLPNCDGLADDWELPRIGLDVLETCRNAYVNPPFGRYYFHPITRDVLAGKEVEEKAERLFRKNLSQFMSDEYLQKATLKELQKGDKKLWEQAKKEALDGYEAHTIKDWILKCRDQHRLHDMDVAQLGPAAVGTSAWQDVVFPSAAAVLFIKGRPRFELVDFDTMQVMSVGDPAPMDCAIVLWTQSIAVLKAFLATFETWNLPHGMGKGRVELCARGIDLIHNTEGT